MLTVNALQLFVILAGLTGQLLIARKDPRGYLAWIAGNIGLVFVYLETKQFALIALQFINTAIQVAALIAWGRGRRRSDTSPARPSES
ncbi:nicotinamide riboside transporter PnuC [Ralstonia sp. GP73]|uniref:Uncharacterized protein n=1 Tax=Ralstonia pickettii (strain 12J) TaxID=402626 RepID=B2UC50_RALPJ|nr:nicotinamide riboside transporter PnuC [Ralstonia sp. GP73]